MFTYNTDALGQTRYVLEKNSHSKSRFKTGIKASKNEQARQIAEANNYIGNKQDSTDNKPNYPANPHQESLK